MVIFPVPQGAEHDRESENSHCNTKRVISTTIQKFLAKNLGHHFDTFKHKGKLSYCPTYDTSPTNCVNSWVINVGYIHYPIQSNSLRYALLMVIPLVVHPSNTMKSCVALFPAKIKNT